MFLRRTGKVLLLLYIKMWQIQLQVCKDVRKPRIVEVETGSIIPALTIPGLNQTYVPRTIAISGNNITLEGKPFRILSGSLHYFRVPAAYWRDRLRKLKAAGLNSVSTYVEWSFHEPEDGQYLFEGDRDVAAFVKMAAEEGLYVLLRPGPYICAERDLGGLPYWLLGKYPGIKLRSMDADFLRESEVWIDKLFTYLKPFLYGYGGPIILVQVENEYGSYGDDLAYKWRIRNIFFKNVESAALLYTTDGAASKLLKKGATPGTLTTMDFGSGHNVQKILKTFREIRPTGPVMNSEYYPGWLTHWSEPMQRVSSATVVKTLIDMLAQDMHVNFYVFFGGTNFEFSSGANYDKMYLPDITSYDYDAPLNEAGDPTPKYFAIRQVLLQLKDNATKEIPVPEPSPKGKYGEVSVDIQINLMSEEGRNYLSNQYESVTGKVLPTFEILRQRSGFVLYEMVIAKEYKQAVLSIAEPRDWINVYVDGVFKGVIRRMYESTSVVIDTEFGSTLSLLVENQGRINYASRLHDYKGILSPVLINNYIVEGTWSIMGYPLTALINETVQDQHDTVNGPVLYKGTFTLPGGEEPLDTFLDTTGWGKGYVWINGYNLGRYWPGMGPQVTLFVPGVWLNSAPEPNVIQILELACPRDPLKMKFVDTPKFSSPDTLYTVFDDMFSCMTDISKK